MTRREPMWRRALRLVKPDAARDVDEELAFHFAMREAEYVRGGASPDQARQMARERFGEVAEVRDACVSVDARMHRSARRVLVLEELGLDLRFALRALRHRPGFAMAVIVTLAIGIGAVTGIFALSNAVLLSPPAQVRAPDELVAVFTSDYSGPPYGGSSYPDYQDFRTAGDVLAGVLSYERRSLGVSLPGAPGQLLDVEIASGNYFDVLGVPMQLGRGFTPAEDEEQGQHPVVVLSDRTWRTLAAADPGIVGREIRINSQPYAVVGVAAPRFVGLMRGSPADLWVPRSMADAVEPGSRNLASRDNRGIMVMGRLRPGVTLSAAQARLDIVAAGLFASHPEAWRDVTGAGRRITVVAEKDARFSPDAQGRVVGLLALLMGAVTLLLLLCGANVTTLLLARGTARAREFAVRLSLGAGRARLIRQQLTENLVIAALGGVAGIWVARQVATGILAMLSAEAGVLDTRIQGPVLTFALLVTLGAGLVVGLAPALRSSRADLQRELKGDGTVAVIARRRLALRDVLVTVQVALSVILLASAGLVLKSLRSTQQVDVGFDRHQLILVRPLGLQQYDELRSREYYRAMTERLASLPGVVATALGSAVPLGGGFYRQGVSIVGYQPRPGEDMEAATSRTSPGYFRLMGVPLLRGRDFEPSDRASAPGVAIVNQTFAQRFWPDRDPLGQRLRVSETGDRLYTVVGVARDLDYARVGEAPQPYFYLPYDQRPLLYMAMHVRVATDQGPTPETVRRAVQDIDPDVPLSLETMDERVARLLAPQRAAAMLLATLGAVGLLLAATGLYGVLAFSVTQRTREFGIRMALGATAGAVRRMVVGRGVLLAAAGLGIGLAGAIALARLATGLLFGVTATDPPTLAVVILVLLGVAAAASWVPARRVTAINPADIIRQD